MGYNSFIALLASNMGPAPRVAQFCKSLRVSWKDLLDPPPAQLSAELVTSLGRIVGQEPKRLRAATQLLRSLEVLTSRPERNSAKHKK